MGAHRNLPPGPHVRGILLGLLLGAAVLPCAIRPVAAQYAGPFDDERSLSEEEQRKANNRSLAAITALNAVHTASIPLGFVPEPITSVTAEIAGTSADITLKWTKAFLEAPPDIVEEPNSTNRCTFNFDLPQSTAKYTNFLGRWPKLGGDRLRIPFDAPIEFGVLGVPKIRHANTEVLLSVHSPSAGILRGAGGTSLTVPAGHHEVLWKAESLTYPAFDVVVPIALTAVMMAAEFKFADVIKDLVRSRSNLLELSSVKGNPGKLARELAELNRKIGLFEMLPPAAGVAADGSAEGAEELLKRFFDAKPTVSRVRKQTMTVYDVWPPTIGTTSPSIVLEATDIGGTTTARYLAELRATITASDECGRPVTVANDLPEVLPLGDTVVTWTVRDAGPAEPGIDRDGDGVNDTRLTDTVTQTITVEDTQAPIMVPPPGLVIESGADIDLDQQALGQPLVVDLADLHPVVTLDSSDPDGLVPPDTRAVVTWSATDVSMNTTTADQLVTVKTPGTNTAPVAQAKSADTLTSKPVDIVLTGIDGDVLPYSHDPGTAVPDPLQFRIEELPQHGEFEAPLLPFFINDYRTDKVGGLIDYIDAQPDADALMDEYILAVNTGRLADFLEREFCDAGRPAPVDFVYEPLYVQVTDEGEHYYFDRFPVCDSRAGGYDELFRISRWSADNEFLGHVRVGEVDSDVFDEEAVFHIDAGNFLNFVNLDAGHLSIQRCPSDFSDTTNDPPFCQLSGDRFGPIDSGDLSTTGSADPRNAIVDLERELVYVVADTRIEVFDFRRRIPGDPNSPRFTDKLLQPLVDDQGNADILVFDQSVCDLGASDIFRNSLAIDSAGNLYVTDSRCHRVHKFTASFFDEDGELVPGEYVGWLGKCTGSDNQACDVDNQRTKGFSCTAAANCTVTGNESGSEIGQFFNPAFLAVDPNDILYVADYDNQRIQRFGVDGTFAGQAQSTGNGINADIDGGFVLGNMGPPKHVSVNSKNFYVVDQSENFVHVFDTSPFKDVTDSSATVTYVSEFAFHSGADTFRYSVNDGLVDSNIAEVTVNVARNYRQPLPSAQSVEVREDGSVVIVLEGTDPDGIVGRDFNGLDRLTFEIVDEPQSGTLTPGGDTGDLVLDPGMQAWTYTPDRDFFGGDSFSFTVRDELTDATVDVDTGTMIPEPYGEAPPAIVDIDIAPVNDTPIVRITPPERVAAGFPVLLQATAYDDIGTTYDASLDWGDGTLDRNGKVDVDDNGTPHDSADDTITMAGVIYSLESLHNIGQTPLSAMHTFTDTGDRDVRLCLRDAGGLEYCSRITLTVEPLVALGVALELSHDEIVDGLVFDAAIDVRNAVPAAGVDGLPAGNVVLSLEIPEALTLAGFAADSGACVFESGLFECRFGTLANGAEATVELSLHGHGQLVRDREIVLDAVLRTDSPALADASVSSAAIDVLAVGLDRDGDGLSNIFEARHGVSDPDADDDGDGSTNLEESEAGTSPVDADSDGDGIGDADETDTWGSDPLNADTDGDGLPDGDEVAIHGTDPASEDSDADGLPDSWELDNGYDPAVHDSDGDPDGDGLTDAGEFANATDRLDPDSDGDGLTDGEEVAAHDTDPAEADTDRDGLDDGAELAAGSEPLNPDTDDDGLPDGSEVLAAGTDPLLADTDRDGLPDGFELFRGRPPLLADYALAAGGLSSCALTDDGVSCWGRNDFGQAPPMVAGLDDPWQLTEGFVHACAIDRLADGSNAVVCWGDDTHGQLAVPPLTDPVQIAAGGYHTCALDRQEDGTHRLACWGRDQDGAVSAAPTDLVNPVRLVAGTSGSGTCVLDKKPGGEELVCWGAPDVADNPPSVLGSDVGALALGHRHGCIVIDGEPRCWGLNLEQQAPPVPPVSDVVEFSLGGFHSCALETTAPDRYRAACWGRNVDGQVSVPALDNPLGLASGSHHSCALDEGRAKCWGVQNNFDQGQAPASLTLNIDPDGDGISTADEIAAGTNPLAADSDRDGIGDADEGATDPLDSDSDDDGVSDGDEVNLHGSNPLSADTDGDGLPDAWEIDNGLAPNVADHTLDADGDGLDNAAELEHGTDPNEIDSDGDGLGDAAELLSFRYRNSEQALGSAASEAVELGDLDGDGDLDAFVANRAGGSAIWTNGGGLFSLSTENALNELAAVDVDLADIDGDGDLDAALAHPVQSNSVWINAADGAPQGRFSDSGLDPGAGASDGVEFSTDNSPPRLFAANWGTNEMHTFLPAGLDENAVVDLLGGNSEDVAVGDLNGDSFDDAFVVNRGQPNQVFLTVSGISVPEASPLALQDTGQLLGGNAASIAAALGDLDGDGDLDAYDVVFGAGDRIWLNDGAGNFADSGQSLGNDGGNDVSLFDVEGDGDLDAFVANTGPNTLWLNTGDGTMIDSGFRMGNATSLGLSLGDVDGDGDTDVFVANDGPNAVWLFSRLDPGEPDSDGDGAFDGWEMMHGFDPANRDDGAFDSDGDGLANREEFEAGTDPHVADSEGDGMLDGWEVEHGLDPLLADGHLDLDRDGMDNLTEFQQNGAVFADDVPPVLTVPPDVTADSVGLLTEVAIGEATAVDARDGDRQATADDTGPFAPGPHTVTWSAADLSGNRAEDAQAVDVVPQVSFDVGQTVSEGDTATVVLSLNGPAVAYPVQVNYTVSGSASNPGDHNAAKGSVMIASGTSASIEIAIVHDPIFENEESFTLAMTDVVNAIPGAQSEHTVTITQDNGIPVGTIVMEQQGKRISTAIRGGGPVTVSLAVHDPNAGDTHAVDWTGSDSGAFDPADASDAAYTIDPSALPPAFYRITALVVDDGVPVASNRSSTLLKVVDAPPVLDAAADSDGDGIDDATEGANDSDGDRVPDYRDAHDEANVLAVDGDGFMLEAQSGLKLVLGESAFRLGAHAGVLEASLSEDVEYGYPNRVMDFELHGVSPGRTALVVIPLHHPLPGNAEYRKLAANGWHAFVSNAGNAVSSAPGSNGACPSPGSAGYVAGLNESHGCVQLRLEDGGANDADGAADGVIRDPGGVAVPVELALSFLEVADKTASADSSGNVVMALRLTTQSGDVELDGLTLQASGSGDDSGIENVRLVVDGNGNGAVDAGETAIASGAFDSDDGTLELTMAEPWPVPPGQTDLLVTYDF